MASRLNSAVPVRKLAFSAAVLLLCACKGEPVPRDYRDNPPAMTHPVTSSSQTPTAHGMPGPAPEPSSGAEGRAVKPVGPPPDAPRTATTSTAKGLPPNAETHAEAPGQSGPPAGKSLPPTTATH